MSGGVPGGRRSLVRGEEFGGGAEERDARAELLAVGREAEALEPVVGRDMEQGRAAGGRRPVSRDRSRYRVSA